MSLGYSYDQRRGKYSVRVTIDGKRTYIGQYDTKEHARAAYLANSPSVLESYKVNFETHDTSFAWLKPFHKWQADRKAEKLARKRERDNITRINNLIEKL